jgi:hypothetical protein
MRAAVQNAAFLKEHAHELRGRGPLVELVFDGDGPVGMHIVQAGARVVVAASAERAQAENRVFFGDHVVAVNGTSTRGMREVKLLIADAERPVNVVLQPLCVHSTRHDCFPLVPPVPAHLKESPYAYTTEFWALVSRAHSLVPAGEPRTVSPGRHVEWSEPRPGVVLVRAVGPDDGLLLGVGDRVLAVDGVFERDRISSALKSMARFPGSVLVVQSVRASGTTRCEHCKGRIWTRSLYCARCGRKRR